MYPLRSSLGRWIAILRLTRQAGWPIVTLALGLNLVVGVLPLGFVVGTSVVLDRLPEAGRAGGQWSPTIVAFALAFGSLLLPHVLAPVQAALGEVVTRRVDGACVRRLIGASLREAPMALLERQDMLDRLSDARAGLVERDVTPGSAVAGLLALVARYAQLVGAVVLVAVVLHPLAGLVAAGCALVARFGSRGSLSRWAVFIGGYGAHRRRLRYVTETGSDAAAAKEMRVLGLLGWWRDRTRSEATAFLRPLWRERRRIYFAPFLFFSALVLAGALLLMLLLRDAATRPDFSVMELAIAIQAILIPLRFGVFFPESDVQTQYGMQAYETIRELERQFAAGGRAAATGTRSAAGMPRSAIRFEGVSFGYPGSGRTILSDLDLELPAGRSTAIVGLNGAGKTTLVKLLARLYEPTAGRILVDGVELRELDPVAWQRRLATIFQDFIRYELDAAANISSLADADSPGTGRCPDHEASVRAAAEWAGATEVLAGLPRGLSTPLSSRYTGGVELSGGQWQRIALARARFALSHGAGVLILDEPTAQLDVRAEVEFFDRFLDLTAGLTSVVISHRFSTVRRADHIVVLADGRVVERGSHDELLARGGRYAELFHLQAQRFATDLEAGPEAAGAVR